MKLNYCFGVLSVFILNQTNICFSTEIKSKKIQEKGVILSTPIVPRRFHGHWSRSLDKCKTPEVDNSQIWISDKIYNFFEEKGSVVRVVSENSRKIVITTKSENEGIVFVVKYELTLMDGGKSISVRDEEDTGRNEYRRCPK